MRWPLRMAGNYGALGRSSAALRQSPCHSNHQINPAKHATINKIFSNDFESSFGRNCWCESRQALGCITKAAFNSQSSFPVMQVALKQANLLFLVSNGLTNYGLGCFKRNKNGHALLFRTLRAESPGHRLYETTAFHGQELVRCRVEFGKCGPFLRTYEIVSLNYGFDILTIKLSYLSRGFHRMDSALGGAYSALSPFLALS